MRIFRFLPLLALMAIPFAAPAQQEAEQIKNRVDAVFFNPPKGWRFADAATLPPHVKMMVIGRGEHEFPPSLNLACEDFGGTLAEYLEIVKESNKSQGITWQDLGPIALEQGEASLSQADIATNWGTIRMMHLIFPRDGVIYILTAAAKKEEFSKYYADFFDAFKTFKIQSKEGDKKRQ